MTKFNSILFNGLKLSMQGSSEVVLLLKQNWLMLGIRNSINSACGALPFDHVSNRTTRIAKWIAWAYRTLWWWTGIFPSWGFLYNSKADPRCSRLPAKSNGWWGNGIFPTLAYKTMLFAVSRNFEIIHNIYYEISRYNTAWDQHINYHHKSGHVAYGHIDFYCIRHSACYSHPYKAADFVAFVDLDSGRFHWR